ncbi:DoxX family protein [Gymnodinialimonas ulvae]|uniref:DoxX family protein n=1 Tax=Gymnodinialimonas ulvae TaxID=3126504 RepID=UPI0030A12C3F
MSVGTADRIRFDVWAHVALRVVIASYFLAVALKLIPGVDYAALFSSFLSGSGADGVAAGLVFLLTVSIMIGLATRLCAMVLSLMTIYAGALAVIAAFDISVIARFWSDLALVAGLMLLYGDVIWERRPRRNDVNTAKAPRRVNIDTSTKMTARPAPRMPREEPEMHNIFQAVDRAKAAAVTAQATVEDLSDHRQPDAPATFLRSRSHTRPDAEVRSEVEAQTDPVDNIFVVDQEGRILDGLFPESRRVAVGE